MVFYRKYRPQNIEELDSSQVRESLTQALSHDLLDIPHAFLFTGPKGLGKTSTARIVAKVINCLGRQLTVNNSQLTKESKNNNSSKSSVDGQLSKVSSIEPCNKCEQCISITNGTNLDVLEMDGASNRGIDEIRELKETIKLAPFSAKRKIYIVDEVHMLTTEAFNALLKTLEEPPEHAVFILCTTELHKVPVTILSRCHHVSFTLATEEELIRSFRRIVKSEKIEIDDEALKLIASLSDGGFRDGVKILEEATSFTKSGKITAADIATHYHISNGPQVISALISSFITRDSKAGLKALTDASKEGMNVRFVIEDLLSQVHNLILAKSGVTSKEKKSGLNELSLPELILLSEYLMRAYSETKYAVISELPLELILLKWSDKGEGPDEIVPIDNDISISSLRRQVGNMAKYKAVNGEVKPEKKNPHATTDVSILNFSAEGEITKEWLSEFWSSLLDRLKSKHHTTAGVLRGCVLKSFDRKNLVLQTSYKFHKERLDDLATKKIIEDFCKELTGNPVAVTIELKA